MINQFEVLETNKMIENYNLDVRTITLGISLLDCISDDLETLNNNIYNKTKYLHNTSSQTYQRLVHPLVSFARLK